ncbi:MAG: superoxide dismutase [Pseudomonadota bacterium]
MDRRDFLKLSLSLSAMAFLKNSGSGFASQATAADSSDGLPPLPYSKDALEPYISARTLEFHYGKHHQAYIDNTRKLTFGTEYAGCSLNEIILKSGGNPDQAAIFNNAAQSFNHAFFWKSMKSGGGGEPKGRIGQAIEKSFGSHAKFEKEFSEAALTQFGSGWAWLIQDGAILKVVKTANADTPMTRGWVPLLNIDVWEHAYYLDYQNRRGDYIQAYLDHLINWSFAESNLIG